ncbi:hypothetical protein NHX12_029397 [Muraenolepis orangiensis]|uniref:DDE Tnp4 domain-containing protein n=1 Tax=Muraenolepis orangiensis TaxID=630683 RepID=A0A9Q0EB32_9TELE|nr:hypothetical protein NHX12_029397 [Muraenolepis orangiensis]
MPRTTVHRIVHRVTEEAVDIRDKVIHLPKTPEDLEAISRGFAGLARHRAFNKAVGAIDGCHVCIVPPGGTERQCYVNRKLFPSISLQAVCDHQGRFIDTYVGWPGHSSAIAPLGVKRLGLTDLHMGRPVEKAELSNMEKGA